MQERAPRSATGDPQPLFLLGMGRSGTTLLQRILNTVDGVVIHGEHEGYLEHLADAYYVTLHGPAEVSPSFATTVDRLKNPGGWAAHVSWRDPDAAAAAYAELIRSLWMPADAAVGRYWGFKEIRYGPHNRVVELLTELFRDARFVFLIRHPIDVLAAQHVLGWGVEGRTDNLRGSHWMERYQQYCDLVDARPDRATILRYEDLVGRAPEGLPQLFDWLDLDLDDDQHAVLDLAEGRGQTPLGESGELPVQRLSSAQIAVALRNTAGIRRRFGYLVPGYPVPSGHPAERPPPGTGLDIDSILELCDGATTVAEIGATLAARHPGVDATHLTFEVSETLIGLLERGEVTLLLFDRADQGTVAERTMPAAERHERLTGIRERLGGRPDGADLLDRLADLDSPDEPG